MNKYLAIGSGVLIALLLVGVIGWVLTGAGEENDETAQTNATSQAVESPSQTSTPSPTSPTSEEAQPSGRYVDYSSQQAADSSYDTTILFFHAPWCPDCRAYDEAIKAGEVPEGTQILKVDYDSNQDLRAQYGVTVQTTFVRVDASGNQETTWVGYGKDGSLQTILENTA